MQIWKYDSSAPAHPARTVVLFDGYVQFTSDLVVFRVFSECLFIVLLQKSFSCMVSLVRRAQSSFSQVLRCYRFPLPS